jgi:hypothetical protein
MSSSAAEAAASGFLVHRGPGAPGARDRLTVERIPVPVDEHEASAVLPVPARRSVGPEDEVRSGSEAIERPRNEVDD